MKIIILGCQSQIGLLFKKDHERFQFNKFNKKQFDITNIDSVNKILKEIKPNIIVNTAAFTDVDLAEIKVDEAFKINSNGPKNLAKIASEINAYLIHFSTDYVFDGNKNDLYNEKDEVNPISIYGKSKLEGEKNILSYHDKYIILRISWLYGAHKNNFVTQILDLLTKGKKLKVIDDQFSKPTSSFDIYNILIKILNYIEKGYNKKNIFNFSGEGKPISRFDFAKKIGNLYKENNDLNFSILPIKSEFYYKTQIRPKYSALNCDKIYKEFKIDPINWKYSLENTINEIKMKNLLS
tara:strand:+ start:15 stop:899 length:885 start_codon:yes stop_codon:yes gene_type:complete